MIITYTTTTVFCDTPDCINSEEVTISVFNTQTQNMQSIKRQMRGYGYIFTRKNNCYCKQCAKKMHLRNANK